MMKQVVVILFALVALQLFQPSPADAGILLRSSRLTSRAGTRLPRIRVGAVRPSTAAAARIRPVGRSRDYGTAETMQNLIDQQKKYQRKLAKWHKKKARAEARLKRKKERQERLEERRRAKKLKKLRKAQQRQQRLEAKKAEQSGQSVEQSGGEQSKAEKPNRFGKARDIESGKRTARASFWSRFWQALIGGGKS
ncbi:MAG: hypothetical protein KDD69_03445 [Bdellovibrionales bacterium]|nr:hypothetical protein [Bdellovibrionales bacterium]